MPRHLSSGSVVSKSVSQRWQTVWVRKYFASMPMLQPLPIGDTAANNSLPCWIANCFSRYCKKDWLLLDEDENEFEKSSEKSSHPMANDYELLDEEDPQSSDLKVRKNFVENWSTII